MRVIPAMDIIDGSPVRLAAGDYECKTSYSVSALDVAKRFEDAGLEYLHLVDLDAAIGKGSNLKILERIATSTSLTVDFGGGIRKEEDVRRAFDSGATKVNIGSAAVKNPQAVIDWGRKYPHRIILSSDARNGRIAVSGWTENTDIEVESFIGSFLNNGINEAVVTDISKDGMLSGPSFSLYQSLLERLPGLILIASGGVSSFEDLVKLNSIGVDGVIVGKAYYEGLITIEKLKEATCLQKG